MRNLIILSVLATVLWPLSVGAAESGSHEMMEGHHQEMSGHHGEMMEGHHHGEAAEIEIDAESLSLGRSVYEKNCATCHATGVAGAPKLGDEEAWASHLAGGMEHMLDAALNGEGAMPPRGGNPQLSDDEVRAAVNYMISESR